MENVQSSMYQNSDRLYEYETQIDKLAAKTNSLSNQVLQENEQIKNIKNQILSKKEETENNLKQTNDEIDTVRHK